MLTFFFIPATKLNKLSVIRSSQVDHIIVDFEDAVLEEDRITLLEEAKKINNFHELWFRLPIRNNFSDCVNTSYLEHFLRLGIKRIVIPKLISLEEYKVVFNSLNSYDPVEIVLLIEHPRFLIELHQVLQNPELSPPVVAIGMGSHDLMTFMKSVHGPEQIFYPRLQLLYLAKAYNKLAIDIASMNLADKNSFESEILFGHNYGYDAKFFIHPTQIGWYKQFDKVEKEQLLWAQKILNALPVGKQIKEIEPFVIDGEVIEKPHVEKALAILEKYSNEK